MTRHKRERVRQERRSGRDERADPRGDPDGHIEHVVEGERSTRHERPRLPEVVLRYRVRAAAVRVGGDRLPVREVDDEQDAHDDRR